jgi:hypothetical protein
VFAALDTLKDRVVGECRHRHRHQEFLKFLRRLDLEFPCKVSLHLVMDNYGTHKPEKVKQRLKRHPRFGPHFVPASSNWPNLVERWFGHLDNQAIRRGVFRSVANLHESIDAFLAAWNKDPNPSSGRPQSNPFRKSSTVVVRLRRRFSRVAPVRSPKNGL